MHSNETSREEKCMKEELHFKNWHFFPTQTQSDTPSIRRAAAVIFLSVLQIKEFLPNRMGQSPPDVPGGGRQVPHVDGAAGQSAHTVEH